LQETCGKKNSFPLLNVFSNPAFYTGGRNERALLERETLPTKKKRKTTPYPEVTELFCRVHSQWLSHRLITFEINHQSRFTVRLIKRKARGQIKFTILKKKSKERVKGICR